MAQKSGKRQPPLDESPLPQNLRESAQQIWMAGLSAFAKAQAGGNKVFEALMKEGEALQSRTRQAARSQVDDIAGRASGTWDKLEQVFEQRVAGALHTLGVPTHEDIDTLSRRVAELSRLVDALQARGGVAAKGPVTKAAPKVAKAKNSRPPVKTKARAAAKKAPAPAKRTPAARAPKKSTARKAAD